MSTEVTDHVLPTTEFQSEVKTEVKAELEAVFDPCSCMSEHPVSIVDLGLVDDIEWDESTKTVTVHLLLTSQRCTYFLDIDDEICERVGSLPDVETVEVHQVTSGEIWTADRMAPDERRARRERFERRVEEADIVPYAERSE
ncbi:metal-sulfur cluster assembly factor [Haloarcula onubensis]|uniref:Iron-sulfur cluster assembly protein n=1 Tax=Haloarcula onubensis TaxID=2950539 RepID=A0ABU2FNT8_9EURY|nr:iron-sulfur cluster assembly protein [Halomicroarcula sp. S3CR25-11]MDS0281917.1 iron-sulfur cluster assembly protein [Halomicroarcula sp. S3CR25-11]